MKRFLLLPIIVCILIIHLPIYVFAQESELTLEQLLEYNNVKLRPVFSQIVSSIPSTDSQGRSTSVRNYTNEWYILRGERKISKEDFFYTLGLYEEAEKANKNMRTGKMLQIGALIPIGVGALLVDLQYYYSGTVDVKQLLGVTLIIGGFLVGAFGDYLTSISWNHHEFEPYREIVEDYNQNLLLEIQER